jgi:phosphoribosylanthranilate isomerase
MKIKICGLFREQDIDFVNEAKPDYIGFVFAESKRQVSPAFAAQLRSRLSDRSLPVGVFVNAPVADIVALYNDNVISIAQLHGTEDGEYITQLKEASAAGGKKPIEVIKTIRINEMPDATIECSSGKRVAYSRLPTPALLASPHSLLPSLNTDYYLIDSSAGSGKAFNWELLKSAKIRALKMAKPWFLAGGINSDNIIQALRHSPYALDVSSGAETDGIKNLKKILQLVSTVRKYALYKRN